MTVTTFFTKLFDLQHDMKVFLNPEDFTELEMRLFMSDGTPTVRDVFRSYLKFAQLYDWDSEMHIMTWKVEDIIFHDSHFKKDRFYEIKLKPQQDNEP